LPTVFPASSFILPFAAHPTGIAGTITLSCRRASGGNITIEISDDGVGLPEGVDPIKSEDFGFRLVRSLADQLGATIAFYSDCLGLRFVLHMPVALTAQFPLRRISNAEAD
jgi:two-component sensor histidine kinase